MNRRRDQVYEDDDDEYSQRVLGMTAVEHLSAFSGESAEQYARHFQYSEETRIVGVEMYAVGNDCTTVRYSGLEDSKHETNNIFRITTADGFEGVSGVDSFTEEGFSEDHVRELKNAVPEFMDLQSLDPVEVASRLAAARPDLSDPVRSSIDIALWDLAARRAGCPLYEMLGAKRDSIEAYASLPFFETLPEYVAAVNEYAELGFTAFKLHVWCTIEQDLPLVRLLRETFEGTGYRFMIDLEEKYTFEDAVRLGEQMDERLFAWIEGPMRDDRLAEYAELRRRQAIPIVPDGYRYWSSEFIEQGIEARSWDAARFDTTSIGGISRALDLLRITNEAGLPVEIQSWGHALSQAANLHVMLAYGRTQYFEAPTPTEAFEFGMKNAVRIDQGIAVPPEGPGLGISVDWECLPTADFYLRL